MSEQLRDAIVVFTARSPERVIREGGSQSWVLNPVRAKQCKWLVCTQNQHHSDHEFSDATEPHCSAFLVGKVSGVVQGDDPDRWRVEISAVARISKPDVWDHWRNPVRYSTLEELGIDVETLDFEAVRNTPPVSDGAKPDRPAPVWPPTALTIPEAKQALAVTFGVKPDAVEITIRG